jgi:hypothetical protein
MAGSRPNRAEEEALALPQSTFLQQLTNASPFLEGLTVSVPLGRPVLVYWNEEPPLMTTEPLLGRSTVHFGSFRLDPVMRSSVEPTTRVHAPQLIKPEAIYPVSTAVLFLTFRRLLTERILEAVLLRRYKILECLKDDSFSSSNLATTSCLGKHD